MYFVLSPYDIIQKSLVTTHFFTQTFHPKTVTTHFGWRFLLAGVFRSSPSQKLFRKR